MIQHNGNALRVCATTPRETVYHLAYDTRDMTKCDQHVSHFTLIPVVAFGRTADAGWCPKCESWLKNGANNG